MPRPELTYLRQKAVVWKPAGFDDYGKRTRSFSVELRVRWEDTKRQMTDPQGNPIAVDAVVVVPQDVPVGSIIYKGSLDDLATLEPGTGTGTDLVPDANLVRLYQVKAIDTSPDLKNRQSRRELGVVRYKQTIAGTS